MGNLRFNPFIEYGVTDYEQYKKFPFLETESIRRLRNKMNSQIRDNFMFPERLVILGEPGAGKTTSLFFIKDMLTECKKCNVLPFSTIFSSPEEFEMISGENFIKVTEKPTYILIDFPDRISPKKFKEFLEYLWNIITHKNHGNISLIFALNISHFSKSFDYSEIFGKFDKFRIDRMNFEETSSLIKARLLMAGSSNYFDEDTYKMIFKYSKGIPRNIICASKNLVEEFFEKEIVTGREAEIILQEEYVTHIIHDRIEEPLKRKMYLEVINILKNQYKGEANSQEELIQILKTNLDIGRNKSMNIISDLSKFGIIELSKGGYRNTHKLISLK